MLQLHNAVNDLYAAKPLQTPFWVVLDIFHAKTVAVTTFTLSSYFSESGLDAYATKPMVEIYVFLGI